MPKKKVNRKSSSIITNFTKYFKEEREVYVQNMGNSQISISFGDGYHVTVPKTRKPYNLTEEVPFELLKSSIDFRKIVNRNPPILRLLEEEEFYEYYERAAERNGTSFEEEFEKARRIKLNLDNKVQLSSQSLQKDLEDKLEDKMEKMEKKAPETHPKAIGLCAQADKEQGPLRISAGDFIEELETLESEFSVEDWEYVMSRGVYKTVKAFATKKFDELTDDEEDE